MVGRFAALAGILLDSRFAIRYVQRTFPYLPACLPA